MLKINLPSWNALHIPGVRHKKLHASPKVQMIAIAKISATGRQPRKEFDQEALLGLAQSIRQNGILQPLSVREGREGEYELIAGERRLRAALLAGLTHVPCLVIFADEKQSSVLALLENLQREDLNFFEEAEGIARLIEAFGLSQEQVAKRLGKSQSAVANKLRLRRLTEAERRLILENRLTERHARALLRLVDEETRNEVLRQVIARGLNVGETEKLVESQIFPNRAHPESHSTPVIKDVRLFLNTVTNAVNVMKQAGIDAVAVKQEYDEYFEYTVRIPKAAGSRTA